MQKQVLPHFGSVPLNRITNAMVREWVSTLLSSGLSAATDAQGRFALRQCLAAAIADERIKINAASAVPLPTERQKPPRYLSQSEVERLVDQMPRQYRALVLVGAYAGLRWGEAAGLRRRDIDTLRSRIRVTSTAVQLRGRVALDNEPKTTRSKRSVPVARSVMRHLEQHLTESVDQTADALVFTAPAGGPLFRSWGRAVLRPAVLRAGLDDITFHGLRHSFVAIMVAAGCNVREVSEWAGHNSVAFTLTRYGGLSRTAPMPRSTALTQGKHQCGTRNNERQSRVWVHRGAAGWRAVLRRRHEHRRQGQGRSAHRILHCRGHRRRHSGSPKPAISACSFQTRSK
jgi:integrase